MSGHFDAYHGVVVDNADPEAQGRVQVQVPDVLGTDAAWAQPEHAGAATPDVGAQVTVRFEQGDESYPIWSAGDAAAPVGEHHGAAATDYHATYRGVVLNNADPDGYGRLQVQVPDVAAAQSVWAMPEQPPPAVGAEVWVRFQDGNPDYPTWTV